MNGALAAAALLLLPAVGRAEVVLQDLRWQVAPKARAHKPVYGDSKGWLQPPAQRLESQPRALAVLANRESRPDDAVLLRYAVSARLAKIGAAQEGTWTVPFFVDDKRIPKIGPNASLEVPLYVNRAVFWAYLKRMQRAGFWPNAIRLQLMIEPRPGEGSFEKRMLERTLPVLWQPAAARR